MAESGASTSAIARAIDIPRSTVRDWLQGKVPDDGRGESRCFRCTPGLPPCGRDYARLLGVYLGDGHIAPFPRGVYRLTLVQDVHYERLIQEWRALAAAMLGTKATVQPRGGCVAINCYSKHWACLFPQHGRGPKHLRPIVLEQWQRGIVSEFPLELIRGLIESDGSRHVNRVTSPAGKRHEYVRYDFTNASSDIRELFRDACDRAGVHVTQTSERRLAVSRRDDVAVLDAVVGPKS